MDFHQHTDTVFESNCSQAHNLVQDGTHMPGKVLICIHHTSQKFPQCYNHLKQNPVTLFLDFGDQRERLGGGERGETE